MLEDPQVSPHDHIETIVCKHCFQEHHHQLMQEQDLSPAIYGDDTEHF